MPNESMSSYNHAILLSKGDNAVPIGEVEAVPTRLDCVPFHRILGRDLVELCPNDVEIGGVAEMVRVEGGPEVATLGRCELG